MPIFHVPTSLKFNQCGNNCQNEQSAETRRGLSSLFLTFELNAAQKRSDYHTKSFAHDKERLEKRNAYMCWLGLLYPSKLSALVLFCRLEVFISMHKQQKQKAVENSSGLCVWIRPIGFREKLESFCDLNFSNCPPFPPLFSSSFLARIVAFVGAAPQRWNTTAQ